MTNSFSIANTFGLYNSNVTYSELANSFLTNGFTSALGNTYFNHVRFAEGILIKEDVGVGFKYTFLNGIKIYAIKTKRLIGEVAFNNLRYTKEVVRLECSKILLKELKSAHESNGVEFDNYEEMSMVEQVLNKAFNEDQRLFAIQNIIPLIGTVNS